MSREWTKPSRDLPATMRVKDMDQITAFLKRKLCSPVLRLEQPAYPGATVQLLAGAEVLGTVVPDDEEGERSFAVTIVVLSEELDVA